MTIGNQKRVIQHSERALLISMYKAGSTLAEVGAHFGVTRERSRQIVKAAGVSKIDGGQAVRSLKATPDKVANLRSKNEQTEARIRTTWGLSLDDYRAHVAEYGSSSIESSPLRKYVAQRRNALGRGIEWLFTFAEWWLVWQESGKWNERGRGGYVMARYGDGDTPYSKATVYICTQSENSKDSFIVSPASVRAAKAAETRAAKRQA